MIFTIVRFLSQKQNGFEKQRQFENAELGTDLYIRRSFVFFTSTFRHKGHIFELEISKCQSDFCAEEHLDKTNKNNSVSDSGQSIC